MHQRRPPRIALVVACTQRKRLVPSVELRLGSIEGSPEERSVEWRRRVRSIKAKTLPAHELYVGDHWRAACEAYELALRYSNRAELWVISAGHGLVRSGKSLKAYSATFASGSPDSVWRDSRDGDRRVRLTTWWSGLSHDAALTDLLDGDGAIVIAAGARYIEALGADIQAAAAHDQSNEHVSIISAGSRADEILLPASGRLRKTLGGTDAAINGRVLAALAARSVEHRFRRSAMSAALAELTAGAVATNRSSGKSATDNHIVRQIQRIRGQNPTISRTDALRHLRRSGTACEQGRFASLWAFALTGKH